MLETASLISQRLSLTSQLVAGNDKTLNVYLNRNAGTASVGGGGVPQVITTLAMPEAWRSYLTSTMASLSSGIDLQFRFVEQASAADIAFYVDREIELNDPSGITFGLTLSNVDRGSGRQWFEIFLNGPELLSASNDFVQYVLGHELGHALGLEHPFDGSDGDFYLSTDPQRSAIPSETLMSYRQPEGGVWPGSYSQADLQALSQIWGAASRVQVYRLYNPQSRQHLFSANSTEIDALTGSQGMGFVNEGVAYATSGSAPQGLHRFFQTATGRHFYSANDQERDLIVANPASGYVYEGVAYRVYGSASPPQGGTAVVRYFDPLQGSHFYSASVQEQAILQSSQPTWVREGIAWYA